MLARAIIAILQFGFVINEPIFKLWGSQTGKEIAPQTSVRRLNTVYNKYEILRARHEDPKPVWAKVDKPVDEEPHEHEKLISTQEHVQSTPSKPWVTRVLLMPYEEPIIFAIKCGLTQWAIKHYEKRIIKAERKVLLALEKGYSAMYRGNLERAEYHLKNAVKQDEVSLSLEKMYYEVNAPVINFHSSTRYSKAHSEFKKIQKRVNEMTEKGLPDAFEVMLEDRKKMEQTWKSGDDRTPDSTNVRLRLDLSTSLKERAVRDATNGLEHELAGRKCLYDNKLSLAYFHYAMANRFYNQAKEEMKQIYGRQYGSVDLKSFQAYEAISRIVGNQMPLPVLSHSSAVSILVPIRVA